MTTVRKERIAKTASRLIEAGVAGYVFPGAAFAASYRVPSKAASAGAEDTTSSGTTPDASTVELSLAAGGRLSAKLAAVEPKTPYDLASLTKPFVATLALRLVAAGKIELSTRAEEVMSDCRGGMAAKATLESLLTHRSGLASWGGLYLDVPHDEGSSAAKRWIISEAAKRPFEPGEGPEVYSDLGYIIAGEMLAKAAGQSLDRLLAEYVTDPLGVTSEVYYASAVSTEKQAWLMRKAPPTENCEWRGKMLQGVVHDENAAAMGGVAGHAGLFGSTVGVAALGRAMLDVLSGRSDFLPRDLLEEALRERPGGVKRLGWDAKSVESSAGTKTSAATFGHLGFTGTSIWCDPERDLVMVLLSNRVHPSRANQKIKGFRPAFHDHIVTAFDGG